MDGIAQAVMQQLAQAGISRISGKIGADEGSTSSALGAAVPLLMSALARNASEPQGADALHTALAEDHDGSVLDDIPGFLDDPGAANGAGILKHVLGARESAVAGGLSRGTGLDGAQVAQILQIAAPLVMGALGRQQRSGNLDAGALAGFLGQQERAAEELDPGLMGTVNTLLDSDQDGSAIDEIISIAGRLFGGS